MSESVSVRSRDDLSGFRIERSSTGHCHSPWFSFDWMREGLSGPADYDSQYHRIIYESKRAFCQILQIGEHHIEARSIIVAQRKDPSDGRYWWRISTAFPMELPKHLLPESQPKPQIEGTKGVIDI